MISRPIWRVGDGPDAAMLSSCLAEHLRGLPRLTRLKRYYDGNTNIALRRREPGGTVQRRGYAGEGAGGRGALPDPRARRGEGDRHRTEGRRRAGRALPGGV